MENQTSDITSSDRQQLEKRALALDFLQKFQRDVEAADTALRALLEHPEQPANNLITSGIELAAHLRQLTRSTSDALSRTGRIAPDPIPIPRLAGAAHLAINTVRRRLPAGIPAAAEPFRYF